MQEFKISTGAGRFELKWVNKKTTWSQLVNRLKKTTRTPETHAEYMKLTKAKQDDIKDVGGFVGGWLKEGRRKNGNVESRSLLTLDADYADKDFWDTYTMLFDWRSLVYSTHKHTNANPRLRLVIALSRDVSAEEYEAIGRQVANKIGIDQFDDTTYQATRLMYWPSTSQDQPYVFETQDGPALDADAILAEYPDWRDISYWPMSSREKEIRQTLHTKQQDPLEKQGIVGAFCRTYTIQEAIEQFLPDIYEPTDHPERFTYAGGSTSGGLVIYDDKYAYSNHATDPAGSQLTNAFDLVRIHLYGDRDQELKDNTPANRVPSFSAMCDFAIEQPEVKVLLGRERLEQASNDFSEESTEEPTDDSYLSKLSYMKNGKLEPTIENAYLILKNDKALANIGRLNEFTQNIDVEGDLPWQKCRTPRTWSDNDDAGLRQYLENAYRYEGRGKIDDALSLVHTENTYHPVRDYLDTLTWDGQPRLDTLLIDYLGADDNELTRAMTRKTFTAAVKRIYQPGCKFDYMLTLTGAQGIGKSTLISKLAKGWFTDSLTNVGTKDAYDQLQGVWMVEMAELTAFRKADIESLKQFISKRSDDYRMAYAKRKGVYPRQCVFIGTTNEVEFLRDMSGNRRYWPVRTYKSASKDVFSDLTDNEIDQILAEAKHRYKNGEPLYLGRELEQEAQKRQSEHFQTDPWEESIRAYLEIPIPDNYEDMNLYQRRNYFNPEDELSQAHQGQPRDRVCATQIWQECISQRANTLPDRPDSKRINDILRTLDGWEEKTVIRVPHYGNVRGFKKNQKPR